MINTAKTEIEADLMFDMLLFVRRANKEDLVCIVRMLSDDPLGAKREQYEDPLPSIYLVAFAAIEADSNNEFVVACVGDEVVGVLQRTSLYTSLTSR